MLMKCFNALPESVLTTFCLESLTAAGKIKKVAIGFQRVSRIPRSKLKKVKKKTKVQKRRKQSRRHLLNLLSGTKLMMSKWILTKDTSTCLEPLSEAT